MFKFRSFSNQKHHTMILKKIILLTSFCLFLHSYGLLAQKTRDTTYKNVIKYNISNPLIFGLGSVIFGYERVINPRQTLSIYLGRAVLPSFSIVTSDTFSLSGNKVKGGFHFASEYRFYLAKENKFKAPHGVYIGPYYSYNHFTNSNNWNIKSNAFNGSVSTDLTLNVHTVGFEIGYQFMLGKRFTLDMILGGPGFAFYNLNANLNGNLSVTDRQELYKRLNDKLGEKIPGYSIINIDKNFQAKGNSSTASLNYRYMINIGFRL